jgi:hypothetical protein
MRQLWELVFTLSLGGHIVADTVVKPIKLAVPAGEVGQESVKQKNLSIQRKSAGPLSLHPYARKLITKPNLPTIPDIDTELVEIRRAWRAYQSTNSRVAVYIYLSSVFAVIMRWRRRNCAVKNARAALRLQENPPQMKAEPFAIMVFCTSDPEIVDAKTRSKWSRVLRYAARAKPPGQRLADFIKCNGGLNECARKFARTARSASK